MNKLYKSLYDEFGEEQTHIALRGIMAKTHRQPSYIELLVALSLKNGPAPAPAPAKDDRL